MAIALYGSIVKHILGYKTCPLNNLCFFKIILTYFLSGFYNENSKKIKKIKKNTVLKLSAPNSSLAQLFSVYFYLCDTERAHYKYQVKTKREDL